ncbi:extracellular solute-binding protein [Arthrobacter dokdonensis]|uniref:extracellular solute-binding protein n=1 Tax=Arthrobacter dokdonellae TaxID=2211210 RepID=UPI000DE5B6B0|nr:extracellular solute-binding protein [Arthrobacter dokdonellae]
MKIAKTMIAVGTALTLIAGISACSSGATSPAAADQGPANLRVWFMQDSVPSSAQAYLQTEFAKENKGSTLTVQVQQWNGIAQKLQTSLPSKGQTPDLVETGSTQTTTFSSVGAFSDITALKGQLGGNSLVQSFVNSATWDNKLYGVPLYAGSRSVYYRKDLFAKAGIAVPQTIDQLQAAIQKLQAANPDKTPGFSSIYLSANDVHAPESWLFANGGGYANSENGKWVGDLTSADSQRALQELQAIWKNDTTYGLDSTAAANGMYNLFNSGQVGMMVGTLNVSTQISKQLMDSGNVGMFAFPSTTVGTPGKTFAGGSNVSISAASAHPALDQSALKIIMGKQFQSLLAKDGGWVPGNMSYADALTGPFAAVAREAVQNSKLTPNTPQWGVATANNLLKNFYISIAKGENTLTAAKAADTQIETALNASN